MRTSTLVARRVTDALFALLIVLPALPLRSTQDLSPKDHSIFVGSDITVGWKGKYYRVIGAENNAVRIILDHKETVLPLSMTREIHIKRGVKLSNLSADVANLRGVKGRDRALAAADAEARRNTMAMQSMIEDQVDSAVSNLGYVAGISSPGSDGSAANLGAEITAQTTAPLAEASHGLSQLAHNANEIIPEESISDLHNTGFIVSLDVSAPRPLTECHVVVIASYTIPGGSNISLNKIAVQPLGILGSDPRKITCELRGFPPGAELKGYRVALYSGGLEVATNLSSRRTDVTRDEAVLFLTTDYVAKHTGETLPPAPILMIPRIEFVSQLGSTPLDQVIYARVGKDGKIIRLSTDATGSARLPSDLRSAADQIAFVPALEKGKPIEGVAKFKLGDLVASD